MILAKTRAQEDSLLHCLELVARDGGLNVDVSKSTSCILNKKEPFLLLLTSP